MTYASVVGKRSINTKDPSTSHSGKTCSRSPPFRRAIRTKRKAGAIEIVVPAYKRRKRRFESREAAVPDLKAMLPKKLPIASRLSTKGAEPSLFQYVTRRETVV